tara:strand:+ start:12163 stop:12537 length:375 start_codon:yes stop_codon:yes gene_type:complete
MTLTLEDFSDGEGGYCVTTFLDGKEFILSHCFQLGTFEVGVAVDKLVYEMETIPTIAMRHRMILNGIQIEMKGMRLTSKAPACSAIVKREYGVKKGLSKKKTLEAFSCLLHLAGMKYERDNIVL